MVKLVWDQCIEHISRAERIVVFPHVSADGDGLGSAFSIALALQKLGKDVTVALEETPERRSAFALPLDKVKYTIAPEMPEPGQDLSIAVDSSDRRRLASRADLYFSASDTIKIDHHIEADPFGNLNYVCPEWGACCEGIFQLLQYPYFGDALKDKDIAAALYCGITTDTGSFSYDNTTGYTHETAGHLVDVLGSIADMEFRLFETRTAAQVALLGRAFTKLEYACGGDIVFAFLTAEDFKNAGADYEDANEVVAEIKAIEGVKLAVFARPSRTGDCMKASLRSNCEFDAAAFALSQGGGGHEKAAGFDFHGEMEDLKKEIISKWTES